MTASDHPRCSAMLEFLGTFSTISSPIENFENLSDGVVLFEALSEIAPDFFDPTTIARHLGDNWVLRQSNLRKLIRNLRDFYQQNLRKDADFDGIDLQKIAREQDPDATQALVELVAAAAVTCAEKGVYVGRIMSMSPDAQLEMKDILESSLGRLSDYDDDVEDHEENELVFGQQADGDEATEQEQVDSGVNRNLFGANHLKDTDSLDAELMETRRELSALKSQALVAAEESERAQAKLRALVEDLQDRLVKRQDELIQLEEDLRTSTRDLDEAKSKLAELEEQKVRMADDLDVAHAKVQQLHKAEATVVAYKKKLEGVGVINQQMNDLEDQAANYLRQIMELEAEVKKSTALQKTVADLQEQVARLEKERSSSTTSNIESANEIADLKSRLGATESAKKAYEDELAELRARQETSGDDVQNIADISLPSAQSAEEREKTMRLQIENKTLSDEVENLKAELAAVAAASKVVVASNLSSADQSRLNDEIARLKEELAAKEKENAKISSDKDKLEAYTKRTLAKFQDKYLVALQECKAKLKEKQDKIEILENRSASERTAQKREERLLSSTIYELGLAIMQNRLKSGSASG